MRFIHTSDWHIGRLFQNISLLDDQIFVLNQIKQYAHTQRADALVIAGDIFDRAIPPAPAIDALNNFLNEFANELAIPIIMISGNHDSAQRLRFGAKQMQKSGLHILGQIKDIETPVIIDTDTGPVAFYGIPYHDPVEVREAFKTVEQDIEIKSYDQAHTFVANKILKHKQQHFKVTPTVLISHCFIDGASESDSERPLSIGGADRVSWQPLTEFDYVALGHLHAPQYKGAEHIRYSGSLMKYSFSEHKQKKGITLVEMDDNGLVSHQHLPIKVKHDLRVVTGTLAEVIDAGKNDDRVEDYILAKLTDSQVLLDPMGRLRQIYPNILQIERTNFDQQSNSKLSLSSRDDVNNERSAEQVFSEFFKQVMDVELSEQQQLLLQQTITAARSQLEQKS